jgi:hypothetical protein
MAFEDRRFREDGRRRRWQEGGVDGANLGWWVPTLTLVVPPLLLIVLSLLSRLEAWMIQPDERAAKVARLLEQAKGPEELEVEVSRLFADVADTRRRKPSRARTRVDARIRRTDADRRGDTKPAERLRHHGRLPGVTVRDGGNRP